MLEDFAKAFLNFCKPFRQQSLSLFEMLNTEWESLSMEFQCQLYLIVEKWCIFSLMFGQLEADPEIFEILFSFIALVL